MKDTAANIFICLLILLAMRGAEVTAKAAMGPIAADWLADSVSLLALLFFVVVLAVGARKHHAVKAKNDELQAKLADAQDLMKRMADHIEQLSEHYRRQE